ncbi:TIGR02680 family protein [Nonomuraea sp. NPDC049152]|uniref:TIGR02680 family protein n=1 Tax=Nonomuraea sp. NPDC049152 TaxID=3154350 RepID=UPI0033DC8B52
MTSLSARFRPSRAGVINVWDYADEEFVFADGRLVLRGHNGSGKTKALEVLFPFILDGVADARRLDPFSGENRTMKSNLLYRRQDAEYGYVWMEFARSVADLPAAETVTLIIGMRAHKNKDGVRTSFFVTHQRLGVDFGLLAPDSRPLTERQLKAVLGGKAYCDSATAYRGKVDARLFGLGRERYTQLLDLLLALRRPLLAKDLDPGKVSATLTSGLSPVDEDLVKQAARDFENLAAVQKQFDDFTTADSAVRAFLLDYTHYLRTHTKAKLTRVQGEIDGTVAHARTVASAMAELNRATKARRQATQAKERARAEKTGLERRLTVLKQDDTYRTQSEIELQRRQIAKTAEEITNEQRRLTQGAQHLEDLEQEAGALADRLEGIRQAITRHATELVEAAERAGITHDGDGPVDTGEDLLTTTHARSTARRGDISQIRSHIAQVEDAEKERRRAETDRGKAEQTVTQRERDCHDADAALERARREAHDHLTNWAARWTQTDDTVAEHGDVEALREAICSLGQVGAPTLAEIFNERTAERHAQTVRAAERLSSQARDLDTELERLRHERDEIAAERDDAPPADDRRTADRDGRPGAPLWRLVRFTDNVISGEAAGIEGALYGAGLLTAWVHPDPALTRNAVNAAEADGYLIPLSMERRPAGPTLSDVLAPEEQDLVAADVIIEILRSIALGEELLSSAQAPAVTTKAQFSVGIHLGARPKPSPEYIGATNRANRRKARLAHYDQLINQAQQQLEAIQGELRRTNGLLQNFGRARVDLPPTKPVLKAAARVAEESTRLALARTQLAERQQTFDTAVADVDAKRRRLRQVAAERSMPAMAEDVDAVERAVDDFVTTAQLLQSGRDQAKTAEQDLAARQAAIARQRAQHTEDTAALQAKQEEHAAETEELRAREEALDAPLQKVLAQISQTEQRLGTVRTAYDKYESTASREHDAVISAQADLKHGRDALATAFGHLFEHTRSFAPYAQSDLRGLMGVSATAPWPADTVWPTPHEAVESVANAMRAGAPETQPDLGILVRRAALPSDINNLLTAFDTQMAEVRAVSENALKNAAGQMSTALRTFQDALDACTEDYRLDHDPTGVVMVYVSDEGGRNPIAVFARRIADRVEEQGILLEEKERTVLEDELLTGLAQQIHDRVRTARDLVKGMNDDTRSRPMSSGTKIGIRWIRSDDLDGKQLAVSRLLDRDAHGMGPAGLAELRGLLREMIRDYRAGHPRVTYQQALAHVLDYRTWYTFELMLAVPGENDVKLTKAKHEQMSGGEKSAAIHLPLFAAANALYSSARPACPRMIALDEAFAGIDDRYKPELLGLTVKFDLDLFMTGHDLWVHYDSVPMAAHYDMHHDKSAHAVSAMLMLWDGEQTIDADAGFAGNDGLAEELLGFRPSRRTPASTDGTLLESLAEDQDPDEEESE